MMGNALSAKTRLCRILAISLLWLCVAPSSYAQTQLAREDILNDFFDLELFSLSKHVESSFDAPAAVYIVTAEDIRRSGATTLPEALRMVPGVQVAQIDGHKWAVGIRGFNTQFTNKLLVLIDGRTIYTPLFAGTLWDIQDLVFDNIEKIEVIRGPGATIWGSNAVNGVINIITKKASQTQNYYTSATISQREDRILEVRKGGKLENDTFYRLYGKYSDRAGTNKQSDGTDANNGYKNNMIGFRLDWNGDSKNTYSIHSDIRKNDAENYFSILPTTTSPFTFVDKKDKESQGANIVAKWEQKLSTNVSNSTQIYAEYDQLDTSIINRDAYIFDFDFQQVRTVDTDDQFIWGLGYRYTVDLVNPDGVFATYLSEHRYDSTFSSFLQYRYGLLPDELYVTGGSKFEYNGYSDFEFQPSIRAEYFPADNQTVWGSVARAVRTPSRGESDLTSKVVGTPAGFVALTFGADYASEELIAYELGYRIQLEDNWLVEVATFFNDYSNLRTSESGEVAPFDDIISPLSLDNKGDGETYGIEINSKYQANENWKLQGSYSFLTLDLHLDPTSTDTGIPNTEGQSPKHQVKLQSFYNITSDIEFDMNLYFVDNLPTSGTNGVDLYTRLDTRVGWIPTENVEVSLSGKNLLDDRHQEFQQGLFSPITEISRAFYLKIIWEF